MVLSDSSVAPIWKTPTTELVEKWASRAEPIYPEGGYSSEGVVCCAGTLDLASGMPNRPSLFGRKCPERLWCKFYGFGISLRLPPRTGFDW